MAVDEEKDGRVNAEPFFTLVTENKTSNSVPNHKKLIISLENGYQALCCPFSDADQPTHVQAQKQRFFKYRNNYEISKIYRKNTGITPEPSGLLPQAYFIPKCQNCSDISKLAPRS